MAPQIISPFDPAASIRLQRMGLLTEDGQINTSAVEAVSVMQAGLLYTQILDAYGDWDSTRNVCRRITSQATQVTDRQVLLIIYYLLRIMDVILVEFHQKYCLC